MSCVIKAVLSNPRRPECGQITIPFPISHDQYDQTIEMLQAMDLGYSVNRDCTKIDRKEKTAPPVRRGGKERK